MNSNLNIQYIDDGHYYQSKSDGKLVPGVTSVVASKDKSFLVNWACKLMHDTIKSKWNADQQYSQQEIDEILETGKKEHTRISKEAADTGTKVHDWIEKHIKGTNDEITDEISKPVKAFIDWEVKFSPQWLACELVVGITDEGKPNFAGRLDAVAKIGEKTYIVDFKTSSGIYPDYFIQTAAYQYALEDAGEKIDGRIILRVGKDGELECVLVPTPYDLDKRTFLALLEATRFDSYIKNHHTPKYNKYTWQQFII